MTTTNTTVRCFNCGRKAPRDAPSCPACRATFRALCTCGAELSVFEDHCAACDVPHVPRRLPRSRHPWVRATKWSLAGALAGGIAWVAFAPREVPNWKLKREAADAFNAGGYEEAARKARTVTERNDSDADAWYLLAAAYHKLGISRAECIHAAERALVANPQHLLARSFLAGMEEGSGRLDRAIEHAEAAAKAPGADGHAWQLIAQLELRKPRPDLSRVQSALDEARSRGRDTLEVKILLADITVRLHGPIAGGADRLPPQVAVTLRSALSALDDAGDRLTSPAAAAECRARLLLALGRHEDAYAAASGALAGPAAGMTPDLSSALRLVQAMALHVRGNRAQAMSAFADVLRERPDSATAAAAAAFLLNADDATGARALLANAAGASDPHGDLHAVLAVLLLGEGARDEASAAIEAARAKSPDNPFFAEILGGVRTAEGRFADARRAYDDAIRVAPHLVSPRVRRALTALDESGTAPPPAAAVKDAIAELEEIRRRSGEDAFVLSNLGRLLVLAGEPAAAEEMLTKAVSRSPGDADIWMQLAGALSASGTEGAAERAATAVSRARMLRPSDAAIAVSEARAWLSAGKPDVAVSTTTESLHRHPGSAQLLRERARAYRELGMWSLAASDYARLSELPAPGDDDVYGLIEALHRAGESDAARAAADTARARASPEFRNRLDFLGAVFDGDRDGALALLRGRGSATTVAEIEIATGRPAAALAALAASVAERPPDPYAVVLYVATILAPDPAPAERLAEARILLAALAPGGGFQDLVAGRILLAEKDFPAATSALRRAAAARPGDALAALYLGESLFRAGNREESLTHLRRAASLPSPFLAIRRIAASRLTDAARSAGDPRRAESLALEALRIDPAYVPAALRAVEFRQARGAFTEAAEVAESLLRIPQLDPRDAVLMRQTAILARLLADDVRSAGSHLDALPPELRDSATGRLVRGFVELGARRLEPARALFESVRAEEPDNPAAVNGLVQIAVKLGDGAAAEAALGGWLASHPRDRDVGLAAARVFAREGRLADALRCAEGCVQRNPDDAASVLELAAALRRVGRRADSVASVRRFASAAPPERAAERRLLAAFTAVRCAIDLEQTERDVQAMSEDPALAPSLRAEASVVRAEALLALGRLEDAERAASAAISLLSPSDRLLEARARFVLGFAAASSIPARRATAALEFLKCTELDRDNLDMLNALASVLAEDRESAPRGLDRARQLTDRGPGEPSYWDTRAAAARQAGELDEAEKCWLRALELLAAAPVRDTSRHARFALRFGGFLRERGKAEAARDVVERAREGLTEPALVKALTEFLAR